MDTRNYYEERTIEKVEKGNGEFIIKMITPDGKETKVHVSKGDMVVIFSQVKIHNINNLSGCKMIMEFAEKDKSETLKPILRKVVVPKDANICLEPELIVTDKDGNKIELEFF